jgi:prepilin-type N-terminal cleavage/methylation domain-containing protein
MYIKHSKSKQRAFTLVELLVGVSIVAILAAVVLPSLNRFVVSMRVDNQISELHRLLLIARSSAVNSGRDVVICPIVSGSCTNDWTQEISVFIDFNQNNDFDLAAGANPTDEVIRVKSAVNNDSDRFQYTGGASLTYNSLGNLPANNNEFIFSYCPEGFTDESRGITVAISGRAFISQDDNNDGLDENRNNDNITCS